MHYTNSHEFLLEDNRFKTFTFDWPHQEGPLSVVNMARAGFYYLGVPDMVQCHDCAIILKGWQNNDDPWKKHRESCVFGNFGKPEEKLTLAQMLDVAADSHILSINHSMNRWLDGNNPTN